MLTAHLWPSSAAAIATDACSKPVFSHLFLEAVRHFRVSLLPSLVKLWCPSRRREKSTLKYPNPRDMFWRGWLLPWVRDATHGMLQSLVSLISAVTWKLCGSLPFPRAVGHCSRSLVQGIHLENSEDEKPLHKPKLFSLSWGMSCMIETFVSSLRAFVQHIQVLSVQAHQADWAQQQMLHLGSHDINNCSSWAPASHRYGQ